MGSARGGSRRARRSVLLNHVIVQRGDKGPVLFHVPLDFGEEALPVFSSNRVAHRFRISNALDTRWYARECSSGELASLLLGADSDI